MLDQLVLATNSHIIFEGSIFIWKDIGICRRWDVESCSSRITYLWIGKIMYCFLMFIVCYHLLVAFHSSPVKHCIGCWALQSLVNAICFHKHLLLLDQRMLLPTVFQIIIWIKEDVLRTNTRYLCKNMKSMAIIACKLQKFSAHKHLLK